VIIEEERQIFRISSRMKFIVFICSALLIAILLFICHEGVMDFLKAFFYYTEDSGVWGMFLYAAMFAVGTI
jgi:hypothetical protein